MTTKTLSCSFIDGQTREFASRFLKALDTPVSLGVFLCLKYRDDISACSHEIDPCSYIDAELFGRDYQAAKLLSKFRESPPDLKAARESAAIDKFWGCESHLADKAPVLRSVIRSSLPSDERLRSVLYRAKEKIRQILGPVSRVFDVDSCNFGPGSSTSIPRRKAHPSNKFTATDITAGCVPFYHWFFQCTWFPQGELTLRESSRVTVVAKTFKADRVIAVEPDWNIFFQKGFGKAIRKRLLISGIDLDHGSDRHGQLSKLGSLTGELATIDLSSASDSISTSLVRFLLPDEWFFCLNSVRTSQVEVEGVSHPMRKFSSMGNGFTFELESLVFYALALATVEHTEMQKFVTVFGDDIIVPTSSVGLLTEVLTLAGFKLNKSKTFSTGYFRESCGAHFFDGKDVKPIYLKRKLTNDAEVFKACNGLRRFANRFYYRSIYDTPLDPVYTYGKRLIRRVLHIPDGYGDGGLVSSFDEVSPSAKRKANSGIWHSTSGIEGFYVKCLVPIGVKSESESIGLYMHKLRNLQQADVLPEAGDWIQDDDCLSLGNELLLSSSDTVRYRVGRMLVKEWCNPEIL
jgi:hypothetical protein